MIRIKAAACVWHNCQFCEAIPAFRSGVGLARDASREGQDLLDALVDQAIRIAGDPAA
ncbi:MAG: hypothetical protein ACHQK9_18020 [Reyranellales bacterium]